MNINENNQNGNTNDPPEKVDYMKLHLMGISLDKAKQLSGNPNLTLTFDDDLESSYKKWNPEMEKFGLKSSKEEYAKHYNQAKSDFTQNKVNQKDEEDIFYWQRPTSAVGDMLMGYNASRSYDLGEPNSPFAMTNVDGKKVVTRTTTEVLYAQNTFKGKDGIEHSLDLYENLHANGYAFRKDENGEELMLTVNRDAHGNPYFGEAKSTDVLKNSMVASMWGPQKMKDSYFAAFGSSMTNALTDAFTSTPGSLMEWIGNATEFMFGEGSADGIQAIGNRLQNMSAISKSKMSYATENAHMFDGSGWFGINGRALSAATGSRVGQLLPIMAGGYLGGGLAAASGLSRASLMYKAMQWTPSIGWASAFAADAFNQEAKEMGVSQNARAALYPAIFGITALTEAFVGKALGGKNLAEGFGLMGDGGKEALKTAIRKEMGDLLVDSSKETQKNFVKRMGGVFADWMQSAKSTRLGNAVSSGIEESLEELIQGVAENSMKRLHDFVNDGSLNDDGTERKYGKGLMTNNKFSYFDGWKENMFLGFIGGGVPGVFHKGQKADENLKGAVHAYAAIDLGLSRDEHKALYDEIVGESGGYSFLNENGEYIGQGTDQKSDADVATEVAHQQIDLVHDIVDQLKETGKGDAQAVANLMGGDNALFRESIAALFTAKSYENELNGDKELDEATKKDYEQKVELANKHADDILSGKLYGEYLALGMLNAESRNEAQEQKKDTYSTISMDGGLLGRQNLRNAAKVNQLYNEKFDELTNIDEESVERYYENRKNRDSLIRRLTNKDEKGNYVEKVDDLNGTLDELNTALSETSITADELEAVKGRFVTEMATQVESLLEGASFYYNSDPTLESIESGIQDEFDGGDRITPEDLESQIQDDIASGKTEEEARSAYSDITVTSNEDFASGIEAVKNLLNGTKSFDSYGFAPSESNKAMDAAADRIEATKDSKKLKAKLNQLKSQIEKVKKEKGELSPWQEATLKNLNKELEILEKSPTPENITELAKVEALAMMFADIIGEASPYGSSFIEYIEDVVLKASTGQLNDIDGALNKLRELFSQITDLKYSLAITNRIDKAVKNDQLSEVALKALQENTAIENQVDPEHLMPYLAATNGLQQMLIRAIEVVSATEDIRDKNLKQIKEEYQAIEFEVTGKIGNALGIKNDIAANSSVQELIALKEKIRQKIEKEGVLSIINKKTEDTTNRDTRTHNINVSSVDHKKDFTFYQWTKDLLKVILKADATTTNKMHYVEKGLFSDIGNFTKKNFDEQGEKNEWYFTVVHNILLQTLGLNHTAYHNDMMAIHESTKYGLTVEQDLVLRTVSAWDNLIAQKEKKGTQSSLHYINRAMRAESSMGFANTSVEVYPENILMVDGIAGGGKSFALMHIAELLVAQANRRGDAGPIQIVLSAQSEHLRNELEKKIKDRQADSPLIKDIAVEIIVEDLPTMIGNIKNGTHSNKIILSDEVSLLTDGEMKTTISNTKDNRIVFFGDLSQMKDITGGSAIQIHQDALFKTWKITQSNRTGLESLAILQDQFRLGQQMAYRNDAVIPTKTQYFDDGVERKGVRMFTNDADVMSNFQERLDYYDEKGLDKSKIGLIVVNEHERQKAIANGMSAEHVKTLSRGDHSVQGMTLDEAYVLSIPQETIRENGKKFEIHGKKLDFEQFNKMMLTAITRPTTYLAFVNETDRSKQMKRSQDIPNRIYKDSDLNKMNIAAKQRHSEQLNKKYETPESASESESEASTKTSDSSTKPVSEKEPKKSKETVKPKPKKEGEVHLDINGKREVKKVGEKVVVDEKGTKKTIKESRVDGEETVVTFEDGTKKTDKELQSLHDTKVSKAETTETTAEAEASETALLIDNSTIRTNDTSFSAVIGHVRDFLLGKEFSFRITRNKESLIRGGKTIKPGEGFVFELNLTPTQKVELGKYLASKLGEDSKDIANYINGGYYFGGYSNTSDLGKHLDSVMESRSVSELVTDKLGREYKSYDTFFSKKKRKGLVELATENEFLQGKKIQLFQHSELKTDTILAIRVDGGMNIESVYNDNIDAIVKGMSFRRGITIDGVLFMAVKPKVIKNKKSLPAFFDTFYDESDTNFSSEKVDQAIEHFLNFNRSSIQKFLETGQDELIKFGRQGSRDYNVNVNASNAAIKEMFGRIQTEEKTNLFKGDSKNRFKDRALLFSLLYNYLYSPIGNNIGLRYHTLKMQGEDLLVSVEGDLSSSADKINVLHYLETNVSSIKPSPFEFSIADDNEVLETRDSEVIEAKESEVDKVNREINQITEETNQLTEKKVELENEINDYEKAIESVEKIDSIEDLIENEVTESEIESIAAEEKIEKEEVVERIKSEVIQQMNDKSNKPPKTFLQKVAARLKRFLLNAMIVTVLFNTASFSFTGIGKAKTYDNTRIENLESFENIKLNQDQINKKSNIDIISEYHKNDTSTYLLVDKSSGFSHLYKGGNLITTYEVGTGQNIGDEQTKTVVKNGKVYWEQGNKQTGAGIYTVSGKGKYKSSTSFSLANERGVDVPSAIHETLSSRKNKFGDGNTKNNRMSFGCLNFEAKSLNDLENNNEFGKGSKVYILPDNTENQFKIIDGELKFLSKNPNVNRSLLSYEHEDVVLKANRNLNNSSKVFVQTIADSKEKLMNLYPTVSNDVYNRIAKIAYGIIGQETSFGSYGKVRGQIGRITDEGQMILNDLNLKKSNPSVGLSQIRLTSIRDNVKKEFGINGVSSLRSSEKNAQATMAFLLDAYVNQINSNQKNRLEEILPAIHSNQKALIKKANKGSDISDNSYVKNVNEYAKELRVYIGESETPAKDKQSKQDLSSLSLLLLLKKREEDGLTDIELIEELQKRIDSFKNELNIINKRLSVLKSELGKAKARLKKLQETPTTETVEETIITARDVAEKVGSEIEVDTKEESKEIGYIENDEATEAFENQTVEDAFQEDVNDGVIDEDDNGLFFHNDNYYYYEDGELVTNDYSNGTDDVIYLMFDDKGDIGKGSALFEKETLERAYDKMDLLFDNEKEAQQVSKEVREAFEQGLVEDEVIQYLNEWLGSDLTLELMMANENDGLALFVKFQQLSKAKGKELFGLTQRAGVPIILATMDGKVERTTPFHEVIHFTHLNLVDADSRMKLYELAYEVSKFKEDGVSFDEVMKKYDSRKELREVLSEQGETFFLNQQNKNKFQKAISRFTRWVKFDLIKKANNLASLDNFYQDLYYGGFRKASSDYLNGLRFSTIEQDGDNFKEYKNLIPSRRALGNEQLAFKASNLLTDYVFNSPYYNSITHGGNFQVSATHNDVMGAVQHASRHMMKELESVLNNIPEDIKKGYQLNTKIPNQIRFTKNGRKYVIDTSNPLKPSSARGIKVLFGSIKVEGKFYDYKTKKTKRVATYAEILSSNSAGHVQQLLTKENYKSQKNHFKLYSIYAAFSKESVFKGLLERQFNNLDIDALFTEGNDNVIGIHDSIDAKDAGETNPMDKASDIIKNILFATKVNMFDDTSKKVDAVIVNRIITHFGNLSHHPQGSEESGLSKLELMSKRVKEYLDQRLDIDKYANQLGKKRNELTEEERASFKTMSEGSYYQNVKAFYNRFFNTEVLSYNGYKDVYALVNQGKVEEARALYQSKLDKMNQLANRTKFPKYTYFNDSSISRYKRKHDLKDDNEAFAKIITDHHIFSSSVLSALGKLSYGNFDTKNLLIKLSRGKDGEVYYNPIFSQSSADASLRAIVADNIAANFISGNVLDVKKANAVFVKGEHWLSHLETDNPVTITGEGIFFENGGKKQQVIQFNRNSDGQITGLEYLNADIDKRAFVRSALSNFGLRSMVSNRVEYNLSDDNGETTFGWDITQDPKKSFLNSITVMMMAAHSFGNKTQKGEAKGDSKFFEEYLTKFVSGNSRYGKETLDSLYNRDTTEDDTESGDNDSFYFPTAFFNELNVIAKGMTMSGSRNGSFHYNAVGAKVFDRQIGNQLTADFGIDEKGKRTNQGLVNRFEIIAQGEHDTHNIRGKEVINEFLRKGGIKVIDRYPKDGFQPKGRQGKKYAQTTIIDQLDYLTEVTVKRLLDGTNDLVAMDENLGDRETQDINIVDFRTGKTKKLSGQHNGIFTFKKVEDKDGNIDWHKSIDMDWDNIINLMKSRFDMQFQAQINSVNRLAKFINDIRELEKFKHLKIEKINSVQNFVSNIQTYGEVNVLLPQIKKELEKLYDKDLKSKDYMAYLEGHEVYTSKDVIVTKKGLLLGRDALFNADAKNTSKDEPLGVSDSSTIYNSKNFKDFYLDKGGVENRMLQYQYKSLDAVLSRVSDTSKDKPLSELELNTNQLQLILDVIADSDSLIDPSLFKKVKNSLSKSKGNLIANEVFTKSELSVIKKETTSYKSRLKKDGVKAKISNVGFKGNPQKYIVKRYFRSNLERFSRMSRANGFIIPKKYGKYKNISGPKGINVHPLYEGMYYAHHFYNEFMLNALVGTQAEFKDITDKNKRLTVARSPHLPFDTSNDFGVDKEVTTVLVSDKEVVAKYFSQKNSTSRTLEMTDGLSFVNPVARWLIHHSAGQAVGANSYEASMKDVQFQRDFAKGKLSIRKRSVDNITEDMMKYAPEMETYLERMLNPTNRTDGKSLYDVFNKFRENNNFKEAARLTALEYAKNRSKYKMDYFIEFTSSNKGASKKNVLRLDEYTKGTYNNKDYQRFRNTHDFTQGGLQLEPYRDTDGTSETKPNQIMNIILGTPFDNATSSKMQNTLAKIGELTLAEMIGEFDAISNLKKDNPNEYRRRLKEYTKKLLQKSMRTSNESSNLVNIINDDTIGIDFPAIEAKAIQYIANEISKKAIKFKMPGMRLNESKVDVELFDYNGFVWSKSELLELRSKLTSDIERANIDKALKDENKRGLKAYRYIIDRTNDDAVNELTIAVKKHLKLPDNLSINPFDYINEDFTLTKKGRGIYYSPTEAETSEKTFTSIEQAIYKQVSESDKNNTFRKAQKGELLAPAHQYKKLGIPKSVTFNQLFTVIINGEMVDIRNEFDKVDAPSVLSPALQEMSADEFASINPLMPQLYKKAIKKASRLGGDAKQMAYRELLKKAKAVHKSVNEILVVRTPSSNSSSANYSQIVGFVNDNGNNLYSSPDRMALDGHDNDIDQATLYFTTDSKKKEVDDLKESLVADLFEYYKNPQHDVYTMRAIDLSELKSAVEDTVKSNKSALMESDLATTFYNKSSAIDGKVVGPFANLIKTFSNVVASAMNLKRDGLPVTGENQSFESTYARLFEHPNLLSDTVAIIGDWANAATDNTKEQILGAINVSINNADAVGAMLINQELTIDYVTKKNEALGIPPPTSITDAIVQVLKSKAHQELSLKMNKYKSVREGRSSSFYKAVVQSWNSLKKYEDDNKKKLEKIKEEHDKKAAELLNLENSNKEKFGSTWKTIKKIRSIRSQEKKAKAALFRKYGKHLSYELLSQDKNAVTEFINEHIEEYNKELSKGISGKVNIEKLQEDFDKTLVDEADKEVLKLSKKWYSLSQEVSRLKDKITYYEGFGDSYQDDLFFLGKLGIIGAANNNALSVFGLDQGTPVKEHEMHDKIRKIEYLFGMSFDSIFDEYKKYQQNPKKTLEDLANRYDKRIEFSKKMYENRTKDKDPNKNGWRTYEISHNNQVLNFERDVHKVFDIASLVFSRPDVMFQMKAFRMQRDVVNDAFFNNHEIHRNLMDKIVKEHGMDNLTDEQYYTVKSQLEYFYIDKFLKTEAIGKNRNFGSRWRNDFGPELISEHGTYVDLSSAAGRQAFLRDFPAYFQSRVADLQNDSFYKNNQFINQLEINYRNKMPFLQFKNPYNIDENMMADIAADFEQLPGKMKGQIAYYQLVKDGFDHRKGGFSKVLDGVIFRTYSKFIKEEERKINANENGYRDTVEKELNGTFLTYLRSNTKLASDTGLVKNHSQNNALLTDYLLTKQKVGDRYINYLIDMKNETIQVYRYPNIGIPYDGEASNVITHKLEFNEEGRIDTSKINAHPIFSVSKKEHEANISAYFDIRKGEKSPTLSIEFASKPSYKVGDTLYLSDGFIGTVESVMGNKLNYTLNPYIEQTGAKYIENVNEYNLTDYLNQNRVSTTIGFMVEQIKTLFPNVEIKMIDSRDIDDIALRNSVVDAKSFIKDGVLHILTDRITPDALIEEYAHLWGVLVEQDSEQDFISITNSFKDTPLSTSIQKRYGYEEGSRMWRHEAFAQSIRFLYLKHIGDNFSPLNKDVADALTQSLKEDLKSNVRDSNKLKKAWKFIGKAINSVVKGIVNKFVLSSGFELSSDNIFNPNEHKNIEDIAGLLLTELINATALKAKALTSENLVDAFDGEIVKAKDFSIPEMKNLSSKDLHTLFQQTFPDSNQKSEIKSYTNGILGNFNSQKKSESEYFFYNDLSNGKVTKYAKSDYKSDAELAKLAAELAEQQYEKKVNQNELISEFFQLISEGVEPKQASILSFRKSYQKVEDELKLRQMSIDLSRMLNMLNYNPNTDVVLNSMSENLKRFDIELSDDFKDKDTFLIIHADESVSIFRLSPFSLKNNGDQNLSILNEIIYDKDGNIVDKIIDKQSAKKLNLTLTQSDGHIQAVQNVLLAMELKRQKKDLKINTLTSLNVFTKLNDEGRGFDWYSDTMESLLPQVKKIFDIKPVRNALSNDLRRVVENDALYDKKLYDQNPLTYFMQSLRGFVTEDSTKQTKSLYEEIGKKLSLGLQPGDSANYRVMHLINKRIEYLDKRYALEKDELTRNLEYRILMEAYDYINNYHRSVSKSLTDINTIAKWIREPNKYENELLQYLVQEIDTTNANIEEHLHQHNVVHNKKVTAIMKEKNINRQMTVLDKGEDIFGRLFKTETGVDKDGNEITFYSNEIHHDVSITYNGKDVNSNPELRKKWLSGEITSADVEISNINDKETFALYRSNDLTENELLYGKWVMDTLEQSFINTIIYKEGVDGKDSEERRNNAIEKLNERWKKGMLPVMPERFSAALTKLLKGKRNNAKQALKAFSRSVAKFDSVFDEASKEQQELHDISNPFLAQFQKNGASSLGSEYRSRKIGVKKSVTEKGIFYDWWTGTGVQNNESMSKNIQDLLNYSVLASKRAIEFDRRVKRPYQNILNYFKYEGINRKKLKTAKDNMDMANSFYERNALGEVQEIRGHLNILGAKIDPNKSLIAATIWSSLAMLGFSPRVGIRSALSVNLEMITKSIAHSMTGTSYFKLSDYAKGVLELIQNRHKVIAINELVMKIVNMDERSLLTHRHNLASKNHALQDDTAHLMLWYGEYGSRLIGMVAHMIHNGSWDAYSLDKEGNLLYDEKKDKRYYKDGKITELGKKIKAATKLELQKVGGKWHKLQKESDAKHGKDGPLVVGDSWRDGENIKAQSDILFSQGMTSDTKSMLGNVMIAQPLLQFSTYLVNKAHLWTQKPHRNTKLGEWIEDPDDPARAKWVGKEMKGFIYTIQDSIELIRKHKSFNGVYQNLTETDKNNLLYASTDIMLLSLFPILVTLLLMGDDEELSPQADFVVNRIIGDAIREKNVNVMFPRELYNKIENPVVMNQLVKAPFETLYAFGDFTNDDYISRILKEGSFMVPGGSLVRELLPFMKHYEEQLKKDKND